MKHFNPNSTIMHIHDFSAYIITNLQMKVTFYLYKFILKIIAANIKKTTTYCVKTKRK